MAVEIERKFLVTGNGWRGLAPGVVYRQGYVASVQGRTVRVRVVEDTGYLTLKGPSHGISRSEFEYAIPVAEAEQMLAELCDRPLIEKRRHKIPHADLVWEIDEFAGANQGLILAEVELPDENHPLTLPDWIGIEVSGDPRYYNVNLMQQPFSQWP